MIKRAVIMIYAFLSIVLLQIHLSESTADPDALPDPDPDPAFRLIQLGNGPVLSRILSGVLALVLNLVIGLVLLLLRTLGLIDIDVDKCLKCFTCGLNIWDGCCF
ncbi:uncharacterized protein LOC129001924 [Macrosteles quadrilineatus]|uniref:uncharacterized protein LOC129001924 n=1 Tax=Macrosteles quadrilineatus TaxID=74068 RepID=UPI0023E2C253|nr:uncharacterized protein LOC129001924 [Macrosteles quadrilineatus]